MGRQRKPKTSPLKQSKPLKSDITNQKKILNKKETNNVKSIENKSDIEHIIKHDKTPIAVDKPLKSNATVTLANHIFFDEDGNQATPRKESMKAAEVTAEETDDERMSEDEIEKKNIEASALVTENDKENESSRASINKNACVGNIPIVTNEATLSSDLYTEDLYRSDLGDMVQNLSSHEIRTLRVFVRGPVFNKIKFVNADKTARYSTVIDSMFKAISITDPVKQNQKFPGVRHILQRQLNSKRNYTNEKITKTAVDVIRNGAMFNIEATSRFYEMDSPKHIRRIWYIFAYRFLPCVNSEWLKAVGSSRVKSQTNMFRFISPSDEAYVRWILEVKRHKFVALAKQDINASTTFQKPKGFHDSTKYSSRYIEIYNEVKAGRTHENKALWNGYFWAYFRRQNAMLFQETSNVTREATSTAFKNSLPDEDEDVAMSAFAETQEVQLDDDEFDGMDPEVPLNHDMTSNSLNPIVNHTTVPTAMLVISTPNPIISDVTPVDV